MEYVFLFSGLCCLASFLVLRSLLRRRIFPENRITAFFLKRLDEAWTGLVVASLVMIFVVQSFAVPSGSMRPTIKEGDRLFANKFIYGARVPFTTKRLFRLRNVSAGDIVIFRFPTNDRENPHYGKRFVKRVVALGGETLRVVGGKLYVNGEERKENYVQHLDAVHEDFGPYVVPTGQVFVMGDNRDRSFDSRYWGPLEETAIEGRVWFFYWPLKRIRLVSFI